MKKEAVQFYCHDPAKRGSIGAFYREFTSAALQMSLPAGSCRFAVESRKWLYNSKHRCPAFWDFHLGKK